MKKLFITFLFLGIINISFGQQSKFIPVIKNEKQSFNSTDKSSVLLFTLNGTNDQISALKTKAENIKNIKLDIKKLKGDNYNCTLTVLNYGGSKYVQRIILALGFENFMVFEGTEKSMSEFENFINNLK